MADEDIKLLLETMHSQNTAAHAETRRQLGEMRRQFQGTNQRIDTLAADTRSQFQETNRRFDTTAAELQGTNQRIDTLAADTRSQFQETYQRMDSIAVEMRTHFDMTAEGLRSDIRLVIEGLITTNERLDRRIDGLEAKVDLDFADTQAMIRFSHEDLDRRLRAVE